jgi:hypothetical protein
MNKKPVQRERRVNRWAVSICFALNRKCLQGEISSFPKRIDAKNYIKELHKKTNKTKKNHHIVPIITIYKLPK